MEKERRNVGISGTGLKMIAVVTMFIDHLAAVLLYRLLSGASMYPQIHENFDFLYRVYRFMRNMGRMAFPIYCFLLVEGFQHTSNKLKYSKNLLLFAILSEVPFDLAFNCCYFEVGYNNVMWTLLIGLIMMMLLEKTERTRTVLCEKNDSESLWNLIRFLLNVIIVVFFMGMAEFLFCSDYGCGGVAAIAALYFFRNHRMWGFTVAVVLLTLLSGTTELFALFMLIPLYFYNGTRGRNIKYFFYAFYPVHLLVLAMTANLLGI